MGDKDKKVAATGKDVDTLTKQEIDKLVANTLYHLEEAIKPWHGLRRMTEEERKASPGKALGVFAKPLALLFARLSAGPDGKRPSIAKAFDVLGAKDGGVDPERFEAELLDVRLYRAQAEQKIIEKLDEASRHFGDDVFDIGEMVMGPGLLAIELARTIAKTSDEYASVLAPVLDAFRGLTKPARKALEEKRAEGKRTEAEKKAAEKKAADDKAAEKKAAEQKPAEK